MHQRNNVIIITLAAFLLGGALVWFLLPPTTPTTNTAASTPQSAATAIVNEAATNTPIAAAEPTVRATADIPVFSFPSCPAINFAVIGDFGQDNLFAQNVAGLIHQKEAEFVITVGDNNYPNGAADTIDDHIGKYYHDYIGNYQGEYGPGASSNNFYPALGNHDWRTQSGDPPLPHVYLDYFTLPGNERYYNVVRGPVEIFILDMDIDEPHGYEADSVQAQWLQEQLAASTATWKIVISHHAPYSSGARHGSTEFAQWPYSTWGADAVFSGDEHNYERLLVDGFPYFVNGLSGSSGVTGFQSTPLAGSITRYNQKHGAIFVQADCYRFTAEFINYDDDIIDHYTMVQSPLQVALTAADSSPQPGQQLDYTLTITNPTTTDINQVAISLTLPLGLAWLGPVTEAGEVTAPADLPIIASGIAIPAGGSTALSFPLRVSEGLPQETSLLLAAAVATADLTLPALATHLVHVTFETLIPRAGQWRYLDDGSDQATEWVESTFDDRNWAEGNAAFGYEGDEITEISFGSDEEDKYITTYFRTNFFVESAADYTALLLRIRCDDGAVVYLNGRELFRTNMPDGDIDYLTEAEATISSEDEDIFIETSLDPSALVDGWNTLAVEVHQSSPDSSDMFFDLELKADSRNDSSQ